MKNRHLTPTRYGASLLALLLLAFGTSSMQAQSQSEMDTYISDLMGRMTLEEKIGQLNQLDGGDIQTGTPGRSRVGEEVRKGRVGSVLNTQGVDKIRELQRVAVEETRLGIPLLVGLDVIHGYQTLFPVPLGMASTWDIDGIRESAHIAATEAGANGIAWTFSPMVDVAPDARWGRQSESAGEDPFLGARIAEAMVEGYQGQKDEASVAIGNGPDRILACVKHFALYGASESGRDYNTVDMSRWRMYNYFLPTYRAAAKAGAGSFMSSFNIVEGMPASGNRWLLTDLLRQDWGFQGFVVTDYATITEMPTWGVGNVQTNAARCLKAGSDMDMVSGSYVRYLPQLLAEGKVAQADIDLACRRVLEAKYRLGLFADPYKYCDSKRSTELTYCKAHREAARRLTAESFVLLKNENDLLPLRRDIHIALVGPLADSRHDMSGSWAFSAQPDKYATLCEALTKAVGRKGKVTYAQGCNVVDDAEVQRRVSEGHGLVPIPRVDDATAMDEAVKLAMDADVVVCAMGESAWMNGEGTTRSSLDMPGPQRRLLEALLQTGKPIVLLNFAGRATVLSWESEHLPAILNVWYGSECADALCDVLFGEVSPSGHLTVSMPRATGQEPLYYNHMNTGRPLDDGSTYSVFSANYLEIPSGPLFPFGYGLSYTTFGYGPLSVEPIEGGTDVLARATIDVTNTGKREGDEVVQLYIRDPEASLVRPVMELKGFRRLHLRPGETQRVSFDITRQMLSFYNADLQFVLEPGSFDIMVGADSKHVSKAVLNVPE